MKQRTKQSYGLLSIILLCVACWCGWWFVDSRLGAVYREYVSPDRRFALVVHHKKFSFPWVSMPGHGSDAPGIVVLRRLSDNAELARKSLTMLQDVQFIQWYPDRVYIPLVLDWPLPAE